MKPLARVAIVGRPNVGKSTLFNRIMGKRRAIVHSSPGVTRDVQRFEVDWAGVRFELVDTGGLFSGIEDQLIKEVESRALQEALGADVMILVTDAESGITSVDTDVAKHMREVDANVIVAVNKCEKTKNQHASPEFFRLGFDRVYPISALHGQGIGDLLDEVIKDIPETATGTSPEGLRLALVGRPNVGKSSLVNALVGEETNIVDARPGTTRDSVDLRIRWHSNVVTLVDTAGIRRQSRSRDGLTSITAVKKYRLDFSSGCRSNGARCVGGDCKSGCQGRQLCT